MKKRMLAASLVISGIALVAGPLAQTGQAAGSAAPSHAVRQAFVCTVNDNGVNFRGGPGPEYQVLGQVNRGQELIYLDTVGDWVKGDLVNGRTGVWIHSAYLDGC
ncbi:MULTISPECIES: SH3 domain-containing protein [unclassified Streptomyces]|uniref:SH3 domain-containing protein n=1 Tax=unclassified Streptomyces TaxID=2593676 RepID=UPI000DD8F95F|nr:MULTISPECIES: SH3 domain-containing protein [unclassified Streptomyces]QZZ25130.1 SH3 domain-containing protein [Streptomyces sp. ST1015]